MADIDSLEKIVKGSKKATSTTSAKSEKSASGGAKTFLNPKQWDWIKFAISGIVLALIAIIVALSVALLQLLHENYLENTRIIREYNDTRYEKLEDRIGKMEDRISTSSAR